MYRNSLRLCAFVFPSLLWAALSRRASWLFFAVAAYAWLFWFVIGLVVRAEPTASLEYQAGGAQNSSEHPAASRTFDKGLLVKALAALQSGKAVFTTVLISWHGLAPLFQQAL